MIRFGLPQAVLVAYLINELSGLAIYKIFLQNPGDCGTKKSRKASHSRLQRDHDRSAGAAVADRAPGGGAGCCLLCERCQTYFREKDNLPLPTVLPMATTALLRDCFLI